MNIVCLMKYLLKYGGNLPCFADNENSSVEDGFKQFKQQLERASPFVVDVCSSIFSLKISFVCSDEK